MLKWFEILYNPTQFRIYVHLMEKSAFLLNVFRYQGISKGLEMSKGIEILKEFEIASESKTVPALLLPMQKMIFSLNIFRTQDISKRIEIS